MKITFPAWRHTLLLALCAPAAQAGRPMAAEDATILDPQQCQLETWAQHSQTQNEYWTAPACNLGAGWELSAGAGRAYGLAGGGQNTLAQLQAKTLLRAPQEDGWGLGLVLASQWSTGPGSSRDLSLNLPLSVQLAGERAMLHANLGWLRQRSQQQTAGSTSRRTWGLALELAASERAAFTIETYGSQRAGSYMQLGARYSLIPGRADIDIAYGDRVGRRAAERYVAIGLTLVASLAD